MAKKFSELPAGGALQDADLLAATQSGVSVKITGAQIKALIDGLIAEFALLLGTASAYDVGTAGDELPTNEDLGSAAFEQVTAFATALQGALAMTAIQSGDLAPVAFTGSYADLLGAPAPIKHNLEAVAVPGLDDDSTQGFRALSCWLLPSSADLWVCVSPAPGAAVWIRPAQVVTSGNHPLVVGLRRPNGSSLPSGWERIRADGSAMTDIPSVYFANHPTYSAIQTVMIDGQYMVRIPKFWYRVNALVGGGVEYLISPSARDGFDVHPAFFSGGSEIDQFWIGAYHAVNDPAASGVKLGSLPAILPQASLAGATGISRMEARNGGGIAGFGSMTWHQICAVKLLALVEIGTPDVRTAVGQGWNSTTAGGSQPTGTGDANWRGIYDLWGLLHTLCTGIEIVGPRIWVADETGTMVDTGFDQPTSGYIGTVYDGDFGWAFLPASTGGSTEGYLSYQWADNGSTTAVRHGGAFNSSAAYVGLFTFFGIYSLAPSSSNFGFRLAKV